MSDKKQKEIRLDEHFESVSSEFVMCYGDSEKKCIKSICSMWVHDDRCPNFDWLGPYKSSTYSKRPDLKEKPSGEIRIST